MWIIPEIEILVSFQTSFPFNIHSPAAQILHVFCQILFMNYKRGNYVLCFMRSLKLKQNKTEQNTLLRVMMVIASEKVTVVTLSPPLETLGKHTLFSWLGQFPPQNSFCHSNNKLVWEIPRYRLWIFESQTSTINTHTHKCRWDMVSLARFPFRSFPALESFIIA